MSNLIRIVGISLFIFVVLQIMMLDSYPLINDSKSSSEKVDKFIGKTIEYNTKKLTFDYLDDKSKIKECQEEFEIFIVNYKKCNDIECKIGLYNDYMDDNVAPSVRKQYKAEQMYEKYGSIGNYISQTLGIFY